MSAGFCPHQWLLQVPMWPATQLLLQRGPVLRYGRSSNILQVRFRRTRLCTMAIITIKGAVWNVLTVLKHKNHNVHILCFSEKQGCSQLFYSEMCIACQNVCFFLVHPLPIYPIVFRLPGLAVGGKQHIVAIEASWVRDHRFFPT